MEGSSEEKKKVGAIEESLKKSGINKDNAKKVLAAWQKAVGEEEITPETLRKVLLKQSAKTTGRIVIQVALDVGAAYGAQASCVAAGLMHCGRIGSRARPNRCPAQTVGNLCGMAAGEYGLPAVVLQALAYFVSGCPHVLPSPPLFDTAPRLPPQVGAVLVAAYSFNVNSGAFLAAVQDLAEQSTGLSTVDKVQEAVNTFKVLQALTKMNEELKGEQAAGEGKFDMLRDLAAFVTLEKAERSYGFEPKEYGITEAQAAEIAAVFAAVDTNDDGVLSDDEFRRLCNKYAPGLSDAEVKAALAILDKNSDGRIQFSEFVAWWVQNEPRTSGAPA
eukprot:scaffold30.g4440.t1